MIGRRIAKYEIREALGSGGMGAVYRAHDPSLGRDVALKILPPELAKNPERLGLFKEEARSVAALSHPNIVTIHSVDEADGLHFLTMELVSGSTLDQVIPKGGLAQDRFFELAIPIAQAVSAAHDRGIVHGDLKPMNVMVSHAGTPKILDFGLAKPVYPLAEDCPSEAPTETLVAKRLSGTVPYMAPEQLRAKEADQRSDVFSLGIILFEMAAGRRPFLGSTNAEIAARILRDPPPSIQETRSDLPHHLSRLVRRCLRKDPRRRCQTARDLCNELQDLVEELVTSRSETPGRQTQPSIAVLPFIDMSEDRDQAHFADGLAEDLINAFSQIHGVQVPARTSAFSFKGTNSDVREIGARLNVSSVLEGSVQKYGNRLRVTANLVETGDGFSLWSESFDRDLEDIFRIQDEITRSIIAQLEVPLRGEEKNRLSKWARRRVDRNVYDLYLQAREAWADRFEGRLKDAIEKFQRVTELEPEWAPAYSGLADCYNVLGWYTYLPTRTAFGAASQFAERALELDPSGAEQHASQALIKTLLHRDWELAEIHFSESIRLMPKNPVGRWWFSFFLVTQGRIEEALEQGEHALIREDPLSRLTHANIGWLHHLAGDSRAALERLRTTTERWPDFALSYIFLGWVYEQLGDLDAALASWQCAKHEFSKLGSAMPSLALQEAHTFALLGNDEAAHSILAEADVNAELEEPVYYSPVNRAAVHLGLGEIDEALGWLVKAEAMADCWLLVLNNDPRFRPLREQRRGEFDELVERVGLPRRD